MALQESKTSGSPGVRGAGYLLGLLGISVLFGWLAHIGPLLTILSGRTTMKPSAAIGFLCAGMSIIFLTKNPITRRSRMLSVMLASVVTAVGFLTMIQYSFHVDLGIDQRLFRDR